MNRIGSEGAVVVEDGKRVVSVHVGEGAEQAANEAAEKLRKKLLEQQGATAPAISVKQQLFS